MKRIFNRKSLFAKSLSVWSAFAVVATSAAPAFAGTQVFGGSAVLEQMTRAKIEQNDADVARFSSSSASAVLDWSKLNVPDGKTLGFEGSGTTFFNLVSGASKSQIDGIINGDGAVWVINPNGIAFGANAQVNVGGLFAAAAGNLSNADQLRDGTATLPAFSSFAGDVSTASGSKFTADQVALMGKTVSAAGDFAGAENLALGAASSLVVDEVAGGRVTINLESFVAKTTDELELGSLNVAGEVRAVTDGALKVNGGVDAGSVYLKSGNDQVVAADIHAKSGNMQLLTQDGDLTIVGGVRVTASGDGTTLQIQTAQNDPTSGSSEGSIRVDGSVIHEGVGSKTLIYGGYNGKGDVTVAGKVQSAGEVRVFTDNGGISIEGGASVSTSGEGEYLRIFSGVGSGSSGGDIGIGGSVSASGNDAVVDIESGYNYYTDGGLEVSGSVTANGENGTITLLQGNGYGSTPGKMLLTGKIEANGTVSATSYDSTVEIAPGAAIAAKGDVSLTGVGVTSATTPSKGSSASIQSEGQVQFRNVTVSAESLDVRAKDTVSGYRTLNARESNLTIRSDEGNIVFSSSVGATILAGKIAFIAPNGSILANNKSANSIGGISEITAADDGFAIVQAQNILNVSGELSKEIDLKFSSGTILIDGNLTAPNKIAFLTKGGDVYVMKGCTVTATGDGAIVSLNASSDVTVAGKVSADAVQLNAGEDIRLSEGSEINADANGVTIDSIGDVLMNGTVNGKTVYVTSSGEKGSIVLGSTANIQSTGKEIVTVEDESFAISASLSSLNGDVTIEEGARMEALNDGEANVYAGDEVVANGSLYGNTVAINAGSVSIGNHAQIVATGSKEVDLGEGVTMEQSVAVDSMRGDLTIAAGAHVSARSKSGSIYMYAYGENSKVSIGGAVDAGEKVSIVSYGTALDVSGAVSAGDSSQISAVNGSARVSGSVVGGQVSYVNSGASAVEIEGKVTSDSTVMIAAGDRVQIDGTINAGEMAYVSAGSGGIDVNGAVEAKDAGGAAFLHTDGDVRFASGGVLYGAETAAVIANGSLRQEGAYLPYRDGRMDAVSLRPAVSGKEIMFEVGGSIGEGASNPFVIDGKVYAIAFGDMSLAAAYGRSLQGGNASSVAAAKDSARYAISSARKMLDGTLTMEETLARMASASDFDDNALLYASGDMYLYTAGSLDANSYVGAGANMTVSAATFGDMSYLEAGGLLTINNVGTDRTPQIAYFETLDGVEPNINNQPNDTVIFVDGRLAGGNLKILNQFGANEAFMVSTPELKSTQGIFGNPTFLHSDLDVANPMEVSAIDYMLQETPRLTLDKDFPAEVDSHVDSVVVPEKDSIQFGRGSNAL